MKFLRKQKWICLCMAIIMTACLCTDSFALMANAESNRVFANVISNKDTRTEKEKGARNRETLSKMAESASSGAVQVTSAPAITVEPTAIVTPAPEGTWANMKLVFTTDLHGQLTVNNYETGAVVKEGSLARAVTKINEERAQVPEGNSFLFDIGDFIYDYSTDFIYEYDDTAVQPLFQAMNTMNYDAITLGNHEFEYGLPYIVEQLQGSGLVNKCVVSNVKDVNTGKHIWAENRIIEKTLTATNGQTFTVKVGVIGETIPTLSKKRADYTGVLTTEDIIQNATVQAQNLKAQGADIVVCLAHSGIGEENPEPMAENVTYALTKVPGIDVVLCGHLHRNFPSSERTESSYYTLPGVDKDTGLVNGKNLIMAAAQGQYIGVADLTVRQTEAGSEIIGRNSKVVKVGNDPGVDENFNNNFMGKWQQILVANCSTILGEIANDANYQNYFGLLEDNSAMQLINNAKMSYAMNYINTVETAYKDCQVIAASSYVQCGMDDAYDYYNLKGDFLQSYMSRIEKYKTALYLYKATGAQIKEWLEWSASAYNTSAGGNINVSENTVLNQNVLQDAWKNKWDTYYVFDGMEYTIDTTKPARYDVMGNLVNNSNRVTSATINGVPINDATTYVVVGDRFAQAYPAIANIQSQKIYSTKDRCQNIVKKYIEETSMNGTLKNITDHNWSVNFAEGDGYVVESGAESKSESEKKPWITKYLGEKNEYLYYQADFSKKDSTDVYGPNIVLASLNKVVTNKDVTVKVNATDKSGVVQIKQALGRYSTGSEVWTYASDVTNNQFTCSENGLYSVLAIDGLGNRSVSYIRLTNINKSILEAPVVDTYTNRKTKITGTAHPGAQIYFEVPSGKVYSTKVGSDGKFSYKLPVQKAGAIVYAYVIDTKGRTSSSTEVIVKRTGPNKPTLTTLKSNSEKVKGKLNDTYVFPVLFTSESKVYVQEGCVDAYKASSIFDGSYGIVEVPVTVDEETTQYTMNLPKLLPGGTAVMLNTIDSIYRDSLTKNGTVDQKVPNKPTLVNSYVGNNTSKIKVYSGEKCKISVVCDKKIYTSNKAHWKSSVNKYQYNVRVPKSNSRELKIYATNDKGSGKKLTVKKKEIVPYAPKVEVASARKGMVKGSVNCIDEEGKKSTASDSDTEVFVLVGGKKKKAKVKEDGTFILKAKLAARTKIVCWATNINGTGYKRTVVVK